MSEKTTDLSQALLDNLTPSTSLVVIDTDFTSSCKSNYHAITTTTVPANKEGIL